MPIIYISRTAVILKKPKECEQIHRSVDLDPLEHINLSLLSPIPVQLDRFWVSEKNKENHQFLSCQPLLKNHVIQKNSTKY